MRELKPPRPASRKAEKQLAELQRRELEQVLRDRAFRESMPRDDLEPPPRID